MNRNYGKLTDGKLTYAPSYLFIDGITYGAPTKDQYEAHGYLEIRRATASAPEGQYISGSHYEERDGAICEVYEYAAIQPMPKTYNKYKLVSAVIAADLIEQLLAFLNDNPAMKMLWDAAQEFNEKDENFIGIRNRLILEFGEEAVTAILAKAEA